MVKLKVESKRDFLHKMKIALNELRETRISLKILLKKKCMKDETFLQKAIAENNELIAIFVKSISTASRNSKEF
jgi:four helix bundle protein